MSSLALSPKSTTSVSKRQESVDEVNERVKDFLQTAASMKDILLQLQYQQIKLEMEEADSSLITEEKPEDILWMEKKLLARELTIEKLELALLERGECSQKLGLEFERSLKKFEEEEGSKVEEMAFMTERFSRIP